MCLKDDVLQPMVKRQGQVQRGLVFMYVDSLDLRRHIGGPIFRFWPHEEDRNSSPAGKPGFKIYIRIVARSGQVVLHNVGYKELGAANEGGLLEDRSARWADVVSPLRFQVKSFQRGLRTYLEGGP